MHSESLTSTTRPPILELGSILLGQYTLSSLVEAEDISAGTPAIWEAETPTAQLIAKTWTKPVGKDVAARAIWNHEVRSLLKLGGLPQAGEYFARLEALGSDENSYFVIVDGGGRNLLASALASRTRQQWLRFTDNPARARGWAGLRRVAAGLQLLHDHGVLHRALTPGCVFTDIGGECDFRLSGFEWSLRLSAVGMGQSVSTPTPRVRAPELESEQPSYSIASDWFDFGLLATELMFGLKPTEGGPDAINKLRRSLQGSRIGLADERDLLYELLTPNPDERRAVCAHALARVELVARRLSLPERSADRPLFMAVSLTAGSELAKAIYTLSDRKIGLQDGMAQLQFIQQDLASMPEITARSSPVQQYVLHGKQISYRVNRFDADGLQSWRAGFCQGLDQGGRGGQRQTLAGREIRVAAIREVAATLKDPRSRWSAWDIAIPFEPSRVTGPGYDAYEFLKFTNHVDALIAASRIWPVRVVERGAIQEGSWVSVEAVAELGRDAMTIALGIDKPAAQMKRAFVEQVGEIEAATTFHLSKNPSLSRVDRDSATWVISDVRIVNGSYRYWFRQSGGHVETPDDLAYLRPTDLIGSLELLNRRLQAIEGLRDQEGMLQVLEDPGAVSRDTLEEFEEDEPIQKLDDTKRKALKEIWRSQPIYTLQGPPGTGKTALLTAMVRRALEVDPSLQFATTAQANSTVDDLGGKLIKEVGLPTDGDLPMVVRLDNEKSRINPAALARDFAVKLESSSLASSAPPHIAKRIATLANGTGREGQREASDLKRLVAEAANIVLATSSSGELSALLKRGKRFDWSIVEEAGKIHGFELALPMQASYRLLAIGDHEQLPAFNLKIFLDLLEHPERVQEALRNSSNIVSGRLGFSFAPMESDEEIEVFRSRCDRWRRMVGIFGHVFDASRPLAAIGLNIAERLTEQHRMHPDICDLVASCFYPDLKTAGAARKRLALPDAFEIIPGSWLPEQRIVFVDMPYVQAKRGARGQDANPDGSFALSSSSEAEAVVQVLSQLRPRGDCLIKVLTPYNPQLALLRETIASSQAANLLPNMQGFTLPEDGELCSTVDGFQGGEADIVVLSLVRNNHASPQGGVGFLNERPRLNVMLSRAKRKLIIVGSWGFFERRASAAALADPRHHLHHLAKVFDELKKAEQRGSAAIYRGNREWGTR